MGEAAEILAENAKKIKELEAGIKDAQATINSYTAHRNNLKRELEAVSGECRPAIETVLKFLRGGE